MPLAGPDLPRRHAASGGGRAPGRGRDRSERPADLPAGGRHAHHAAWQRHQDHRRGARGHRRLGRGRGPRQIAVGSAFQRVDDPLVEVGASGGHGRRGGVGGPAARVRDDAAGPADDRHKGCDVPEVHEGVVHDVRPARGDQHVAVAVAPGPGQPGLFHQRPEPAAFGAGGHSDRVACQERGVLKPPGRADRGGPPVERRAPVVAHEELLKDRLVDASEDGLPLVDEADQRAEERDSRREGLGAVDRVQDPDELRVRPLGPGLLANDPVAGELLSDQPPHKVLGAPVGGRDRGQVRLELHLDIGPAEEGADEVAARSASSIMKARWGSRFTSSLNPRIGRKTRKIGPMFWPACRRGFRQMGQQPMRQPQSINPSLPKFELGADPN